VGNANGCYRSEVHERAGLRLSPTHPKERRPPMSTQTTLATGQAHKERRPLPEDTDYIGKGRIAACCARRRYHLRPDADEMDELINHAASVYWHYYEVQGLPPSRAWVASRDRSATYYFRKMRGARCEVLREIRIVSLEDPISGPDEDLTYLDRLSAAAQEATDLQRLDWLGHEDLVIALVEGRRAAGVSQRAISYALNLGTIHNEATIIRLASQGHTNESIATLLDTTEGTIKNRRQRIRRWLMALAEKNGVADLVEEWDKSGGEQRRAAQIQAAYPGGRKAVGVLSGSHVQN
jgi:DNA-binding CsgD family transcriptional regulator